MKITSFIDSFTEERKLEKVRSASNKKERRVIEEKLLLPEELPPYIYEEPTALSTVDNKTVTLVFPDTKWVDILSKYCRISKYKGKNIKSANLKIIIDFLTALENGEIQYDSEKRKFKYSEGSTEVRSGERRRAIKRERRKVHKSTSVE